MKSGPRLACCQWEWRSEIWRATDDLFDVTEMARRALPPQARQLLPWQQHEFIRLLRDILEQCFVTNVHRHTGDAVPPLHKRFRTFARVRAQIRSPNGSEVDIEYRLSRSGPQWKAYDVVFDGMSLVSSYRSQVISSSGLRPSPTFWSAGAH